MYKNIVDTITKFNIYERLSFNIFKDSNIYDDMYELDTSEYSKLINFLSKENDNKRILLHCLQCKNKIPFSFIENFYEYDDSEYNKIKPENFTIAHKYPDQFFSNFDLFDEPNEHTFSYIFDRTIYVDYLFRCSINHNHIQKMSLKMIFSSKGVEVVKYSQDPLNILLNDNNLTLFKNELKKFNVRIDYQNALQSESRNLYAGASTYLRRIYEKIIVFYINRDNITIDKNTTMEEKVNLIKTNLDLKFLEMSKNLYSLLSQSIHEISDKDISQYYVWLNSAILYQLSHEKEIREKEIRDREIKKHLDLAIAENKNL